MRRLVSAATAGAATLATLTLLAGPASADALVSDDTGTVRAGDFAQFAVADNDAGADKLKVTSYPTTGFAYFDQDQVLVYAAPRSFHGTVMLQYAAFDPDVPEDDNDPSVGQLGSPATVTIEVTPIGSLTAQNDTVHAFVGETVDLDLGANDTNSASADYYTSGSDGLSSTLGSLYVGGGGRGQLSGTDAGTEILDYEVRDGVDGTEIGQGSLTVTVEARDVTLTADSGSTPANEELVLDVLGNDVGILAGDTVEVSNPVRGDYAYFDDVQRKVVYSSNTVGKDTFTYTVHGNDGAVLGTQTVSVTVTAALKVSAHHDEYDAEMDTPNLLPVTDNDRSDDPVTLTIVTVPAHGTATVVPVDAYNARIRYTPTTGYTGPDSLSYQLDDHTGHTSTATVSLHVKQVGVQDLVSSVAWQGAHLAWTKPHATTFTGAVVRMAVGATSDDYPDAPSTPHGRSRGVRAARRDLRGRPLPRQRQALRVLGLRRVRPRGLLRPGHDRRDAGHRAPRQPARGRRQRQGDPRVDEPHGPRVGDVGLQRPRLHDLARGHRPDRRRHRHRDGAEDGDTARLPGRAHGAGTDAETGYTSATPRATNAKPTAVADFVSLNGAEPVTFWVDDNDSDPDADGLQVVSTTQPDHGSVTCQVYSSCTYTPTSGTDPLETDTFSYTLSDGQGGRSTAVVTLDRRHFEPQNHTGEATSAAYAQFDVLGNDTGHRVTDRLVVDTDGFTLGTFDIAYGGDERQLVEFEPNGTAGSQVVGYTLFDEHDVFLGHADLTVNVALAPYVTMVADHRVSSVNAAVTFSGRTTPARAGAPVQLERYSAGAWHVVQTKSIAAASTTSDVRLGSPYSFTVRERASGFFDYRVAVPADADRARSVVGSEPLAMYAGSLGSLAKAGNEYVVVKNSGTVDVNLKGWTITTKAGKVLTLPSKALAAGRSVQVHPGHRRATTSTDIYLQAGCLLQRTRTTCCGSATLAKVVVASKRY